MARPLRRSCGVVMILTLLGLVLLAALLLYVVNHGQQVKGRLVVQHSADAAAAGGATWMARSFNSVAMNNVAMTRYLAMINTLDAMPTATHAAALEQTHLRDALQQRMGTINTGHNLLDGKIDEQLQNLLDELNDEVAALAPIDDLFANQYDVAQMTAYDTGRLWQAIRSLDEMNQAVMDTAGELAQVNAVRGGEAVLTADRAQQGSAVMMPILPQVPFRPGVFNDFERPVRFGRLPDQIDDPVTNRGPYDAVFGWRDYVHENQGGGTTSDPPEIDGVQGGGPNPFGGGPRNRGVGGGVGVRVGYRTYGTQAWTLRRVDAFHSAYLYFSRFAHWVTDLSNTKLGYVWPGTASRYFATPDWDIEYPDEEELETEDDQPLAFSETGWFRLSFKSLYPRTHTEFNPVFVELPRTPHDCYARVNITNGWWLPNRLYEPQELEQENNYDGVTVTEVGAQAWLYEYEYQVYFDNDIGITPVYDSTGNMVLQDVYFVQLVVFAGINRYPIRAGIYDSDQPQADGHDAVTNPYEGFDPTSEAAPAPTDLDHSQISDDPDDRRKHLTFLGLAQRSDDPQRTEGGPGVQFRFTGNKPYPFAVAMAQMQVFNNHSWDLWTPAWHAQMQNIDDYGGWIETIDDSIGDADGSDVVSQDNLEQLGDYLRGIGNLAPIMLKH